jgi:hypothetical protein
LNRELWRAFTLREAAAMELMDLVIEAEAAHLDWCTDPSDLERALAKRLLELEPRDDVTAPVQEKLAQLKLAKELGRVTQHLKG